MLLYLIKHSHSNLANMTRELSKTNNGESPMTYKELLHVIRYVLDTKNLGLKIKPMMNSNEPWEIFCFSNSYYVGSISGFILYVLGVLISWQFQSQKSVFLSSSDAEYIALSEAVTEVMFVVQLLGSTKFWLSIQSW